jgi:hypothetical protein
MALNYYATSVGIGETDYMALVMGVICIDLLAVVYYYLFKNLPKIFGKPPEISKRRYYEKEVIDVAKNE